MLVRTASAAALIALFGLAPAFAQSVTPAKVLAAKSVHKTSHGFADRTARLASIMGPETAGARLQVPTRPNWKSTVRRDANAAAGLR